MIGVWRPFWLADLFTEPQSGCHGTCRRIGKAAAGAWGHRVRVWSFSTDHGEGTSLGDILVDHHVSPRNTFEPGTQALAEGRTLIPPRCLSGPVRKSLESRGDGLRSHR